MIDFVKFLAYTLPAAALCLIIGFWMTILLLEEIGIYVLIVGVIWSVASFISLSFSFREMD